MVFRAEGDQAIKGQKAKQPYAIAMKDGKPFGLGGLWENLEGARLRASGSVTFAIITTPANELVSEIHDRMPLDPPPGDYARWLSDELDPRDLMRPFPAEPMRMWPISTEGQQAGERRPLSIVEPIVLSAAGAASATSVAAATLRHR